MVKFCHCQEKGVKRLKRVIRSISLSIPLFLLAIFPGLCIAGFEPFYGTPDQEPAVQYIRQGISKDNTTCRLAPEKREEELPFLSVATKAKNAPLETSALGEEEFESEDCRFLSSKRRSSAEEFRLEFTTHEVFSYQVMYRNSRVQPRAPPYIL